MWITSGLPTNRAQLKNVAFVGMTRAVYDRRIMTTIRILFFLLTAVVSRAQTPESAVSLADTQQRTLTSAKIGQRYELLVSLPAGYAKSGESYPVLYVLDGWHFPLMAFIQENNVYSKRMRPVIIVNVSHGATDYMALRARDFTPTRTPRERTRLAHAASFGVAAGARGADRWLAQSQSLIPCTIRDSLSRLPRRC